MAVLAKEELDKGRMLAPWLDTATRWVSITCWSRFTRIC